MEKSVSEMVHEAVECEMLFAADLLGGGVAGLSLSDVRGYLEFCAEALPDLDDLVLEWVSSADFDAMLVDTVRSTYPAHEHDKFIAHFRGLVGLWVKDQGDSQG